MSATTVINGRPLSALTAVALAGCLLALVFAGGASSAFPGSNGKIVFASDRDGGLDVYSMEPDGSVESRLTNTIGDDTRPMWSSDGTRIVFSSRREGVSKIFTMNAAGTAAPTRVTDPLTTVSGQGDQEPSWSRSGTRIAFFSDRELGFAHIWTVNADGTGLVRLTSVGENLNPVWSPTADLIAFTSDRDADGDYEIFTMDGLGGNVFQRTSNTYWDSDPDWSPDGTRLAFQSFLDGQFDIQVLDLASGTLSRLTNDPAFDTAPAWSPDGTKIVFQSNRDGDWEIFTMSANGSGVQQLTNNSASDRVADWQPLVGPGDTTAPSMVLPGFVTVDATSPAGAVVTYGVSVSDAGDPNPTVLCSPASGATFAIGVTIVSCTATDRAGNSSSGSFLVTVRGLDEQVQRLLNEILTAVAIPPSQRAFLAARLRTALALFDPSRPQQRLAVCSALGVFSAFLSVWPGIPELLEDKWRADVQRIRSVLNC